MKVSRILRLRNKFGNHRIIYRVAPSKHDLSVVSSRKLFSMLSNTFENLGLLHPGFRFASSCTSSNIPRAMTQTQDSPPLGRNLIFTDWIAFGGSPCAVEHWSCDPWCPCDPWARWARCSCGYAPVAPASPPASSSRSSGSSPRVAVASPRPARYTHFQPVQSG